MSRIDLAVSDASLSLLSYPFDLVGILRKRNKIRSHLLATAEGNQGIRVAILGGATTSFIKQFLEIFLLRLGFSPTFYESQFNRFYEEAVFDSEALTKFAPEIVFIHTTSLNVVHWPPVLSRADDVKNNLDKELNRFEEIWTRLINNFKATVIQNNFDFLPERTLGSLDAVELFGKSHFVSSLNRHFSAFAREHKNFLINDIAYLSARVGLNKWWDPNYWYSYKMSVSQEGSLVLAHHVASLIQAIYGKSRKCLVLDLDNTLWGGIVGEDGPLNLQLGSESPLGEAYLNFQKYCLSLKKRGVLLAVCSKNDKEVAESGFSHPDCLLKLADFAAFRANWEPKPNNILSIAKELNISLSSMVFVDDNPVERQSVADGLREVAVPNMGTDVARFVEILDGNHFFQVHSVSKEDLVRTGYYQENSLRVSAQASTGSYAEFLESLQMQAEIAPFIPQYLDRITQLINKTNQFNLTTQRLSFSEVESLVNQPSNLAIYGKLRDKFGDNGLISIVAGRVEKETLDIFLWLMSCRVLKRDMEYAMLNALIGYALERGISKVVGRYIKSKKNGIVEKHYERMGFNKVSESAIGTVWELQINASFTPRKTSILRPL